MPYFIEEINRNKLMSKKHKEVCRVLNYFENLLILASTISKCVSIAAFDSLVCIPIESTNSAIALKICVKIEAIKTISQ